MRHRQDVRALRHEVHAAEHDVVGVRMLRDRVGELERVAGVIGELDHFVALVVVAEDDEPIAERRARRCDAQRHLLVGQTEIRLRERLPLADRRLLDFVQDRQERAHGQPACETFLNLRTLKRPNEIPRYC